jgi:hypothetical protein
VLAIGSPLLGVRVFHGADMVLDRAPWRTTPPEHRVASNPIVGDTVTTFMPLHAEIRRRLAGGDWPSWTSYPAGGLPLGTVPDAGSLGPLNLPLRILPLWYAPGIAKLVELAVAAGFTFLFLRRLGLIPPAALMGGLVFAMSGFQVVWTNWPQSHVGALIPALFWSVERGIERRSVGGVLPVAVVVAAMVFEGFPSVTGYAAVAVGAYAIVRATTDRSFVRRERTRALLLLSGAAVVGLAVTALQVLPLADRVGELDLSYRMQSSDSHLPPSTLVTLALPNVFGSPVDDTYLGPLNYVEIQGFIGASSLVLVVVALASRGSERMPRGVWPYLWVALVVVAILLYVGGPLLAGFQLTSLFRLNFVGRLRSVLGFLLAVLAAVGLDAVLARRNAAPRWRPWVVWGAAVLLGTIGLWRAWVLSGWGAEPVTRWAAPVAAGVVTVAAVLISRRCGSRAIVGWVIPAVFGVEALLFAAPYWPRIERDAFYPITPAHLALHGRLGHDRMVGAGGAFFPGTTTFFGIRSLTTNNTLPQLPPWEALLRAADPAAFAESPVFPSLAPRADVATSPILDRLAVRYFTVPPNLAVFGHRQSVRPPAGGVVALGAGDRLETAVPGHPIRAVLLHLPRPPRVRGRVTARILDPGGAMVGEGYQLLTGAETAGILQIPITQPCGVGDCPPRLNVEIGLVASTGELTLRAAQDGEMAMALATDPGDGLRLDLVENVVGYRRTGSLPRIRWAGLATVITDPTERVRVLESAVDPGTIVLSRRGPKGSGETAELTVLDDSGDQIRLRVAASGPGYVVVADPLQEGWAAEVDGTTVKLRDADHAVVAVLVPGGRHDVRLVYNPPGWDWGRVVSAAGVLLLIGSAIAVRARRRSIPAGSATGHASPPSTGA